MDDDTNVRVDIDPEDEGSARARWRRRRAALRRTTLLATALLAYVTLHECGHAMACDLAHGFTLDEIEVVNVRVYPVFGAGSGWRKLGARFGETRCAQDASSSSSSRSTKTRGVILMSGFIFTSAVQVLALVSATCGLIPYGVYFICPDWLYYALSPHSEFQKGLSLARPEWVMQLEEPDDPETQWTSYNTAIAMIVSSLGTMFFCLQMRQLVKSQRA